MPIDDNDVARIERIRYLTEERGVNMAGVRVILEMEEAGSLNAAASEKVGDSINDLSERR